MPKISLVLVDASGGVHILDDGSLGVASLTGDTDPTDR